MHKIEQLVNEILPHATEVKELQFSRGREAQQFRFRLAAVLEQSKLAAVEALLQRILNEPRRNEDNPEVIFTMMDYGKTRSAVLNPIKSTVIISFEGPPSINASRKAQSIKEAVEQWKNK